MQSFSSFFFRILDFALFFSVVHSLSLSRPSFLSLTRTHIVFLSPSLLLYSSLFLFGLMTRARNLCWKQCYSLSLCHHHKQIYIALTENRNDFHYLPNGFWFSRPSISFDCNLECFSEWICHVLWVTRCVCVCSYLGSTQVLANHSHTLALWCLWNEKKERTFTTLNVVIVSYALMKLKEKRTK